MYRKTAVLIGLVSLVAAAFVFLAMTAFGRTGSETVKTTATAFAQDVLSGNGEGACALLSPPTRAATEAELAVLYSAHYTQGTTNATCAGYFDSVAVGYFGAGRVPQLPASRKVVVSRGRATVTFPETFDLPLDGSQIRLVRVARSWRVQQGFARSRAAAIQEADAPTAAISAWNQAVQDGAVQPPALAGLPSQQIWAFISPGGPYALTIDTPSSSITYIQQPDGSWVTTPAANPPQQGTLHRNVWLDGTGLATPASAQAR